MNRRHFMKSMGLITLSAGIMSPILARANSEIPDYAVDHTPAIWGSPFINDSQSRLYFPKANYREIVNELAHFHMCEKAREVYLFEISY